MNSQEVKDILGLENGTKIRGRVAYPINYVEEKLKQFLESKGVENEIPDLTNVKYKGEYILTLDAITTLVNDLIDKPHYKFTKGKWRIRGNKIFVEDSYNSILQVHVQKNYEETTFKAIKDVEAEANLLLVVNAPEMYHLLVDVLYDKIDKDAIRKVINDIEQYK